MGKRLGVYSEGETTVDVVGRTGCLSEGYMKVEALGSTRFRDRNEMDPLL